MFSVKSIMQILKKKSIHSGVLLYLCLNKISVSASSLENTKVVTGTQKLMEDATSVALIIAPLVGIVLGIYFHIRKSAADEQDQKIWDKRIHADIYSVIGAIVFSSVLKAVLAYYK